MGRVWGGGGGGRNSVYSEKIYFRGLYDIPIVHSSGPAPQKR